MFSHQIPTIFMVLILIQIAFAKPFNERSNFFDSSEEEMRKNPTPPQKLLLYTFDNFLLLGQHFATNAVNVSRYMLKDESLIANTKPAVVEFKKNLTMFVEKYETTNDPLLVWDILDIYTNATDYFDDLPEEKVTPESTFIVGIMDKYNCKDIVAKLVKELSTFMDNFVKMFEENKTYLDKPMLDWYSQYNKLTDFDDKIDAYSGFIELA